MYSVGSTQVRQYVQVGGRVSVPPEYRNYVSSKAVKHQTIFPKGARHETCTTHSDKLSTFSFCDTYTPFKAINRISGM